MEATDENLKLLSNICNSNEELFAPMINLLSLIPDIDFMYIDDENFHVVNLIDNCHYIYAHQPPVRRKIINSLENPSKAVVFDRNTFDALKGLFKSYKVKHVLSRRYKYDTGTILLDIKLADYTDLPKIADLCNADMLIDDLKESIFYDRVWIGNCSYDKDTLCFIYVNLDNTIGYIYVDEEHRNRGFGKDLVRFITNETLTNVSLMCCGYVDATSINTIDTLYQMGFEKSNSPVYILN